MFPKPPEISILYNAIFVMWRGLWLSGLKCSEICHNIITSMLLNENEIDDEDALELSLQFVRHFFFYLWHDQLYSKFWSSPNIRIPFQFKLIKSLCVFRPLDCKESSFHILIHKLISKRYCPS